MTKILKHTFASKVDADSNVIRSISMNSQDFNKIKEGESSGDVFGLNSKDVIEFSAFTQQNELVGWKTIQQTPNYTTRNVSYLDTDGNMQNKTISYLQSLYPKTNDGNILISPKYELSLLGIEQGEYKVRIAYRNDIVGSFENPYKFQISEISGSRTEIKAVTQSFKNSRNPNQVSFNFEYNNFINKQVVVAHVIEKLKDILLEKTFVSELETKEFSEKTSDYSLYIEKAKKSFSLTELEVLKELDTIYNNLKDTYMNFLYGNYNEVFSRDTFYTDYIKLLDYTLNTFSRFVQEDNPDIKLFYKFMLIQMFNESELNNIFTKRFDEYLTSGMNFGNGLYVPFLKYTNFTDSSLSENSNDVLLIKLLEPLDESIEEGVNFYISQNPYSDDLVKSIILRSIIESESNTFKLRGPNLSTKLTSNASKKYSLSDDEKESLNEEDETNAENYFKTTNTEIENLNIDYSDFKNFVKFSSARARLDNFVLKLTNVSKIKFKINEAIRQINKIKEDLSFGKLTTLQATSSIDILKNEDIKKYNESISEIFKTFTPYDKFLYFNNEEGSWPRETSFHINGFDNSVQGANGLYKLHASRKYDLDKVFLNEENYEWKIIWDFSVSKWKLFKENSDFFIYSVGANLNSGFVANDVNNNGFENQSSLFRLNSLENESIDNKPIFPPELIPTSIIEFQKTDGYAWYKKFAKEADLYDKYNDDSLRNSLPEFLLRTNENDEFTLFLGMIGEQFDILLVYIENMREMSNARNSFKKGIPNQLVWFVMNSFGVRLSGRTSDELSIGKQFEENRDKVWRRILNNLPYILKTAGTETSIRTLFKCYGIPDYLFKIREYGGINYNTDLDDSDASFKIGTFDYALQIDDAEQYLEIPLGDLESKTDSIAIEMKLSIGSEFFENTNDTIIFNEDICETLPANMGTSVEIDNIIDSEDDYIIGSSRPRFYTKSGSKDARSFIPRAWKEESDVMAISWKNFREGVSFSYPKVKSGTEPSFVTIYSDRAIKYKTEQNENGEVISKKYYDPLYTLAEIGAQNTLNGQIVRLSFNISEDRGNKKGKYRNNEHTLDFRYEGTIEGSHYTISELKENGYLNNDGFYPILQTNKNWEFGIYRSNQFREDYGKFYVNFYNTDGVLVCPSKMSNPIFFGKNMEYDVLFNCVKSDLNTDSEVTLHIKRMYDSDEVYSDSQDLIITEYTSKNLLQTTNLYFGNYNQQTQFRGTLDKLRVYLSDISEERFVSHINNNQGYDIDKYIDLENKLLVKVNFDHPHSLTNNSLEPGIIKNYGLVNESYDINAYNFNKTEYPYHFVGKNRTEISNLPAIGAKAFNNNKIRIETQTKIAELNPSARATKKSKDRTTVDSNSLGVYFSPTDIVNQEIVRFFGQINMGEFIGDPQDTYNYCYKKLEGLRKIFFKHGFGKLDIQKYFNLIKSYIDPSLFDNLEKLVPARANLLSGLLIEPSLLERHKIIPPKIKSESFIDLDKGDISDKEKVTEILNIDFNLNVAKRNISSFGNDREYLKTKDNFFKLTHDSDIKVFNNNSDFTYDYNYCGSLVGDDVKDLEKDIFTFNGVTDINGSLYKVEKIKKLKKIGTQYSGKLVNYDIFLNDGLRIVGFSDGLESANGMYDFKFKGNSGLPVFTNQNRKWWVFYSTLKNRWVIASDNTVDGGKYLALNRNQNYENFTWLSGNKIIESNTNTPEWFSTGFNNSLESDNLPNDSTDYFGRVNFVSKYDRFIDCDAYLNGWVNAELFGVYKGTLTERIVNDNGSFTNLNKPNDTYIFSGEKKYLFLNGSFKGKLQNGWVGSDKIQQTDSDKNIRIVGFFDGKNYESCDDPFYTSGLINSLVSFDNRDKLVFDFSNYNSNDVQFTSKEFDSINLVKIPNTIKYENDIDFKFISDFNIKNQGISEISDLSSGKIVASHKYESIDTFYSPDLYDVQVNHKIELKTNSIQEVKLISKRIKYKNFNKSLSIKINGSHIKLHFKNNEYSDCEIISKGGEFREGLVYDLNGNGKRISTELLLKNIQENINYTPFDQNIIYVEKLKESRMSFCYIYIGDLVDEYDLMFVVALDSRIEINNKLNNENFSENAEIVRTEKETEFESTPMHYNGLHQFIRQIELVNKGKGYTGQEEVEIYGKMPNNWKSSWPQKIKAYKLFEIDNDTGVITGVKADNFLISGISWITDLTLSFYDTPKIKISYPQNNSRFTIKEQALINIISGEPTPYVNANVILQNYIDLELGDTIGKSLNSPNMYFEGRRLVRYDTGLVHSKRIKIQTSDKTSSRRLNPTDVIIFSNESIMNFELYLDTKIKEVMRSDICGNNTPISSDTYEIQITNFLDSNDDTDYEITYIKNRDVVNNFFIILNENEQEKLGDEINNEQYVNRVSKINENKYSEGYIRINGFTTNQSSANGLYSLRNDISYCDNFGNVNVPIPTYTNENREWILTYDEEISRWKLRNLKTLDFIVSTTKYIEDGFLANPNNNQGFYTGREIIIKPEYNVDKNGFVFENGEIIGNKFQEANVKVSNRFKIVPNKLLFRLEKESFNNFLMWKVKIKSKTNGKFLYEIPIVYINSDSSDELFITKYNNLENKLKTLNIVQYQETSACNLNFQNAVDWKIKLQNEQSGEFSENKKINTQGMTYINSTCFSKIQNADFNGRFSYVGEKIYNEKSAILEYSESSKFWKLKTVDRDTNLDRNFKYPKAGVYKTTTKNIYGICEYEMADQHGNLALRFRNFSQDYEDANGLYYSYGYLETGEYFFRNENSKWSFYTNDGGVSWELRNDRNFPTKNIVLYSAVEQVGVYTDKKEEIKVYTNFEIDFTFDNKRDFLEVDTNSLHLNSDVGNLIIYNRSGYEKEVSDDLKLDVKIDIINSKKKSRYYSSIPCNTTHTIGDLYSHNKLFIRTTNSIKNYDIKDNLSLALKIESSKNIDLKSVEYNYDLSELSYGTNQVNVGEFYTNKYDNNKKYKTGDKVIYSQLMWEAKKDTPFNRSVIPGIDFDTGSHWKIIDRSFTELNVQTELIVKKKKYNDIVETNFHSFDFSKQFVKLFKSQSEINDGIDEQLLCHSFKNYTIDKKYLPCDLSNVGTTKNVVSVGRVKTHTYNGYTRNMRSTQNSVETTIDKTGYLCDKPAIVRTFKKSDLRKNDFPKDSFWFNEDKTHTENSLDELLYEKPDDPIISFRFEDYDVLGGISLLVSGFSKEGTIIANGTYNRVNSSYNDTDVFQNMNGFYIFKNESCWVLQKSSKPIDLEYLEESNIDYTTSDSKKIDSNFNGNFGSSVLFTDQVGIVEVIAENIIEKTPTPTPEKTPTPSVTITPTQSLNESPFTPESLITPTPTKQEQTPTPDITITPTPAQTLSKENPFIFEYGDFAITKQKYDLTKNSAEVEARVKEDLNDDQIIISGIMSVEEIFEREETLSRIPSEVKSFAITVQNYAKLENDKISVEDLSKYGWDSGNTLANGKFRTFYLSKNKLGLLHEYDDQHKLAEYGYYIKSWIGPRNVAVKVLNQIDPVTDLSATKGLPEGVNLKWKPSYSANYIRIEYKSSNSDEWEILADKISQTRSTLGYLDESVSLNEERQYRVVSVGLSGKETISDTTSGWKLGIPLAPNSVNATYGKFSHKIDLNWDDSGRTSQFNTTESYTILRSESNEFTDFSTYETIATDIKEPKYTDELNTSVSTIYWYVVVANNAKTKIMTNEEFNQKINWSESVAGKN